MLLERVRERFIYAVRGDIEQWYGSSVLVKELNGFVRKKCPALINKRSLIYWKLSSLGSDIV